MFAAVALVAPVASAKKNKTERVKPGVAGSAYYWESQQSQAITDPTTDADIITLEGPNTFCPTTPGGGLPEQTESCEPGRLPVMVANSDYETPEMMSAVGFDLSLVPFGAKVKSFNATFIEANDEQSQSFNHEKKKLQACMIEQFFGDGEAREYEEAPKFKCTGKDPIATRKKVKVRDAEGDKVERFAWSFDLTRFAKKWATGEVPIAAIMLQPVQPKEKAFDPATDSNWRVVLAGGAQEEEHGVLTEMVFTEPPLPEVPEVIDPETSDPSTDSGGFDPVDTGSSGGVSTTSDSDTGTPEATEEPVDLASGETAAEEIFSKVGGLPWYAWLGLLAGMIGFSALRSVVLESSTGARPGGVLAQIHRINAERKGVDPAATAVGSPGPLGALIATSKSARDSISKLVARLPFPKRKA